MRPQHETTYTCVIKSFNCGVTFARAPRPHLWTSMETFFSTKQHDVGHEAPKITPLWWAHALFRWTNCALNIHMGRQTHSDPQKMSKGTLSIVMKTPTGAPNRVKFFSMASILQPSVPNIRRRSRRRTKLPFDIHAPASSIIPLDVHQRVHFVPQLPSIGHVASLFACPVTPATHARSQVG